MRDAANRDEFLDRVKREAGFEVEILTGDEEARRTLIGIRSGLPVGVTDLLALDIGGGSTEFVLDRSGQRPVVRSINIGVVRLCERLLHHDLPTNEESRQAREWVARDTKTAVADMANYQTAAFVGTAGTITSLAAMAQKLPSYGRRRRIPAPESRATISIAIRRRSAAPEICPTPIRPASTAPPTATR